MKTILHIINETQTGSDPGQGPLRLISSADAVVLIENAVYNAVITAENQRLLSRMSAPVFVLMPDLKARGLDKRELMENIHAVGYDGFADLSAQYDISMSW